MKVFLTGGTGLIGYNLVQQMLREKRKVRLLVRSREKAQRLFPKGCEFVEGDITDKASFAGALKGCAEMYHAAGLPEQWLPQSDGFEKVNVQGTQNVIEVSLPAVKRFIYLSTIDVFKAKSGETYNEDLLDDQPKDTAYERSKQKADALVVGAMARGLRPVFIHPSGLFGPGPETSPGINDLIVRTAHGQVPSLLPGAVPLVYGPDLARGILLAAKKGKAGERFIFSSYFFTLKDLYKEIAGKLGVRKVPFVLPLPLARAASGLMEVISKITRKPPLIPRGQLTFLQWGAIPSAARAQRVLKWQPSPFDAALEATIAYLRKENRISA